MHNLALCFAAEPSYAAWGLSSVFSAAERGHHNGPTRGMGDGEARGWQKKKLAKRFKGLRLQMSKHSLGHQILEGRTRRNSRHSKKKAILCQELLTKKRNC